MIDIMSEFLTVDEIAKLMRVHRNTVKSLIDSGELPAVRMGVQYRIHRSDWDEYLKRKTIGKKPQEEE